MFRIVGGLLVLLTLMFALPTTAQEPQRYALVIGNQSYHPSVGALKNPHNDIALVAAALQKQGFNVLPPVRDARRAQILGAVRELVRRLNAARPGAVGFVYYSGHGAAEKDTNVNYLIPVDVREPDKATFWDESLKLDDILKLLDGARNAAKFVVFDACRNELQLAERTSDKGLIPVREHQGMFIAYSTAPGRTASDRGTTSGPYAAALAVELGKPGLDHLNLFQNVKEAVLASSGGVQQPWESNGLGRRVFLTGEPKQALLVDAAERAWDRVRDTKSTEVLTAFAQQFSGTVYAAMARERLAELRRLATPIAAPPAAQSPSSNPAPQASIEPTCFEVPSDSPDIVIRNCSALLAGTPAKPTLERALNRRGMAYMRSQQFKEALADFDRLIASNKTNAGYFDNRQSVHRSLGQLDLAVRDANETVRLSPDRAFGYHSRGNIYLDMGRYDSAVADFTRAISAKGAFIYSTYDRGRAYMKLNRFDLAARDFSAVISKQPDSVWTYRERALAYIGLKIRDKAEEDLQHFLRQEPNDPEALKALESLRQLNSPVVISPSEHGPSRTQAQKPAVKQKVLGSPSVVTRQGAGSDRIDSGQAPSTRPQAEPKGGRPPVRSGLCFPENAREGGMVPCDDPRALR